MVKQLSSKKKRKLDFVCGPLEPETAVRIRPGLLSFKKNACVTILRCGAMGVIHVKKKSFRLNKYWVLLVIVVIVQAIAVTDFVLLEKRPFPDALFESMCTALYVDCASGALVTKVVHVLLGLTTMAVLAVVITEGVDYLIKNTLEGRGMKKQINAMRNHIIVCGYGELGKTVCQTLANEKEDFVVIDIDAKTAKKVADAGFPVVEGDALEAKTLQKAGIARARRVVSALNSDSSNVFLTLTVKELNPRAAVATRAYSEDAVGKLHRAGADVIVMPEIIGGLELAKEILDLEDSYASKLVSSKKK